MGADGGAVLRPHDYAARHRNMPSVVIHSDARMHSRSRELAVHASTLPMCMVCICKGRATAKQNRARSRCPRDRPPNPAPARAVSRRLAETGGGELGNWGIGAVKL